MKNYIYEWVMNNSKENACAVYGICYHVADKVESGDLSMVVYAINKAIDANHFYKVEESDERVFNTVCRLFYIDPMLIKIMM